MEQHFDAPVEKSFSFSRREKIKALKKLKFSISSQECISSPHYFSGSSHILEMQRWRNKAKLARHLLT